MSDRVSRVDAYSRPLVPFHDTYQRYYVESLRAALTPTDGRLQLHRLGRATGVLTRLRALEDRGLVTRVVGRRGADLVMRAARRIEGPIRTPANVFHDTVGQYVAHADGRTIRFCVDSADTPFVSSPPLLEWADVYFKTNRWYMERYPASVRPLVNGDPLVLPEVDTFRAARARPKDLDLSFVVRVWGGRDTLEGVEHNIRLLEALSKVPGETLVLAVVQAGDTDLIERRLEGMGIRSTRRAVDAAELWDITARSRLTVMRLGLHWCIPWRATGLLASGAAPVFDRAPFSEWPQPLAAGENFLDLGLDVGPDAPTAEESAYREVVPRVAEWLADDELSARLATANADYFDHHLAPLPVGRYMLDTLLHHDA